MEGGWKVIKPGEKIPRYKRCVCIGVREDLTYFYQTFQSRVVMAKKRDLPEADIVLDYVVAS